jgi:hypothetical protein
LTLYFILGLNWYNMNTKTVFSKLLKKSNHSFEWLGFFSLISFFIFIVCYNNLVNFLKYLSKSILKSCYIGKNRLGKPFF